MRFLLLILLLSCSRPHEVVKTTNHVDDVIEKARLYKALAKDIVDEYGWLPEKCDGLLFNSLAAYSGFNVNPMLAEKNAGEWHRHPSFTCYPDESASSISRDMFRGLLIYLHWIEDIGALSRIDAYGEANHWYMGEAKDEETTYGRVLWTPTLIVQLKDAIKSLNLIAPAIGDTEFVIVNDGFGAHLHQLSILLDSMIYGGITEYQKKVLKEYSIRQPKNALFQAMYHKFTDGNQQAAIDILMDESLFPADRLPNSSDHCAHYLWERDIEDDLWNPCDRNQIHPGIDLMFVAKLIGE